MIKGNGPCNRDRLRTRVKAWEDGAWVREAAMAHARKEAAARGARRAAGGLSEGWTRDGRRHAATQRGRAKENR